MGDVTDQQASETVKITGVTSDGTETFFVGADSSGNLQTVNDTIVTNSAAKAPKSTLIAGSNGISQLPVLTDDQGRIITTALTGFGADFAFGDVTLAAIALAAVRRTAYIEQTTNAQRSIASASALDTAAGTGARTVEIIYYTATFTGPFTETVTLNGTTYVNTAATDICYIEDIRVRTVGSTGSNAGILTLKAATAGGGATIGTISATNNQTFWAHHYVKTGVTCSVTGISCSHSGTTVGSGGVFILRSQQLAVTNAVDKQVSDSIRLYGQASTFLRTYPSPIKIVGPARLVMYVTPETASSTVYRTSIDFFET
jgi:hypothetical protein